MLDDTTLMSTGAPAVPGGGGGGEGGLLPPLHPAPALHGRLQPGGPAGLARLEQV